MYYSIRCIGVVYARCDVLCIQCSAYGIYYALVGTSDVNAANVVSLAYTTPNAVHLVSHSPKGIPLLSTTLFIWASHVQFILYCASCVYYVKCDATYI